MEIAIYGWGWPVDIRWNQAPLITGRQKGPCGPHSNKNKTLQVAAGRSSLLSPLVIVLQVDLGLLRFVTAIGTQGAISKETKKKYYVKTYRVDISSNEEDWITIKEGNKPVVSLAVMLNRFSLLNG